MKRTKVGLKATATQATDESERVPTSERHRPSAAEWTEEKEHRWAGMAEWTEYEFLALLAGMNPMAKRKLDSGALDRVPGFDVELAKDKERVRFAAMADPFRREFIHTIGHTAYETSYAGKSLPPTVWVALFDKCFDDNGPGRLLSSSFRTAVSEALPVERGTPAGEARTIPVPRLVAQEATILEELKSQGYDPLALPKPPAGKGGVKAMIRTSCLRDRNVFFSRGTFDDAWQRLRDNKDIKDK